MITSTILAMSMVFNAVFGMSFSCVNAAENVETATITDALEEYEIATCVDATYEDGVGEDTPPELTGNWYEDFEYEDDGRCINLKRYIGEKKDVYIPGYFSEPSNKPVCIIGRDLFKETDIDNVTIDDNVEFAPDVTEGMFMNSTVKSVKIGKPPVNTSFINQTNWMFYGCTELTSVDIDSGLLTSVKTMDSMFSGCTSLKSVDINWLDLKQVRSMSELFNGCESLTDINIETESDGLTNINNMFDGCTSLSTVSIHLEKTKGIESSSGIFKNCKSLKKVDMKYSIFRLYGMEAWFDGCPNIEEIILPHFKYGSVQIELPYIFCNDDGVKFYKIPDRKANTIKPFDKSVSGYMEIQGDWLKIKNGKIVKDTNGTFNLTINDKKAWYVVQNGKVLLDYTGFAKVGNTTMYYKNGYIDKTANGTYCGYIDGIKGWYVVKAGKAYRNYTGFSRVGNSYMYYKNGKIDKSVKKSMYANINGEKKWYYVKNGKAMLEYTGFASVGNSIMYYRNGTIDKSFTGIVCDKIKGVTSLYFVQNGKFMSDYNGDKTFVIKNGEIVSVR